MAPGRIFKLRKVKAHLYLVDLKMFGVLKVKYTPPENS